MKLYGEAEQLVVGFEAVGGVIRWTVTLSWRYADVHSSQSSAALGGHGPLCATNGPLPPRDHLRHGFSRQIRNQKPNLLPSKTPVLASQNGSKTNLTPPRARTWWFMGSVWILTLSLAQNSISCYSNSSPTDML